MIFFSFSVGLIFSVSSLSASKQLMWRFHRGVASPHKAMTFHLLSSPDFPTCWLWRSLGHACNGFEQTKTQWFSGKFAITSSLQENKNEIRGRLMIVVILTMVSDTKNKTLQNHICFCFKGLLVLYEISWHRPTPVVNTFLYVCLHSE